ncbi:MAG: hypothetical protein J5910_07510 [Lachnospiraceae bacterium]|nr:hypothetical protein [Lachnospiraceae bacterium]
MNRKIFDKDHIPQAVFAAVFLALLILPVIFMNFKKDQISEYENKKLEDWPEFELSEDYMKAVYNYVNDRIGFREGSIAVYTEANNALFGSMVNPLFMWGEEGHIYYKDKDYIAAYQRLNTDRQYIDSMVSFLEMTNDYLASKDIKFLYFVCPDKKTIYPEYFPKTVNVNEENQSVLDYLDGAMADSGVEYIDPRDHLTAAKGNDLLYNKLYDVTHWNDRGAFIGHLLIDEKIQKWFDDVPRLDAANFDLENVHVDSLDNAKFSIDEDIPLFSLRDDQMADYTELLKPVMECETDTFYTHHINQAAPNNRRLLVFTDSYFQSYQKFYDDRFREVYFVHRQNYDYVQYFVNLTFPDMVIFETAERSISSEMPLTSDFSDYYYEPAYKGDGTFAANPGITYDITDVAGGRVDGANIYLDPNDTTAIFRMDAVVSAPESLGKIDVYAVTDDECIETDYCKLHRQSEEEGIDRFSLSIQRRFMAQQEIRLFAVSEETHKAYLLETFEVRYDGQGD